MGKSGRHKKLNRQEKAKTQLKGVKKLLKAQNVVNPTLKVKKIVIREQLAAGDEDTPTTKKHQTLQEISSALHHHNTNIRKDALSGLLEIVTQHHHILKQNLGTILERIAALTSDIESVIRKENLKVSQVVFERIEESDVQPFWNLLLSHLQCTLTHLNTSVRYSTLPFFHLLVAHFPHLVASSAPTILTSLLGLISSSSSHTKTHLKIDISSRKDEVQERLKVFALIDACLQVRRHISQAKSSLNNSQHHCSLTFMEKSTTKKNSDTDIVLFSHETCAVAEEDEKDKGPRGLLYTFGYDVINKKSGDKLESMSLADMLQSSSHHMNQQQHEDENHFWPRFVSSCVSCLMETWMEVGPASSSSCALALASSSSEPRAGGVSTAVGGKARQRDFDTSLGSDKKKLKQDYHQPLNHHHQHPTSHNNHSSTSTNLNSAAVDILKSLVNVMVKLIAPPEDNVVECDAPQNSNDFAKDLTMGQGADLKKYFFNHLPFIAIQESHKKTLTTVNLQLFLLAAQLQLMDGQLMNRLEGLIDELIKGGTLDSEQCNLILKFLSCSDPGSIIGGNEDKKQRQSSLSTEFIVCVLSCKDLRREMCKFLQRVLRPDNTNVEELFLVESLQWDAITDKLMSSFSRISCKWLNLLTHIALRNLSEVKCHLLRKIHWFQKQLEPSSPAQVWNECLRLFWYADAMSEFQEAFEENLPQELHPVIASLQYSRRM